MHITAYFTTNEVEKDEVYSVRNFHVLLTEDEKAPAINRTPLLPFHAGFTFHFVTFAMSSLPHKLAAQHSRYSLSHYVSHSIHRVNRNRCSNDSIETASSKKKCNKIAYEWTTKYADSSGCNVVFKNWKRKIENWNLIRCVFYCTLAPQTHSFQLHRNCDRQNMAHCIKSKYFSSIS